MYTKNCSHCTKIYKANGPAGRYCSDCTKLNKYIKLEKGISYNEIKDNYKVIFSRESCGYLKDIVDTLSEARLLLIEWDEVYPKEPNTGAFNNACRGGLISNQHNFRQKKLELLNNKYFICNRCNKQYLSRYYLNLHHIDHNRDNDNGANFEILCTYCHREHHNKRGADGKFISQGSTTIPEGSTLQVNGSGSGVSDE